MKRREPDEVMPHARRHFLKLSGCAVAVGALGLRCGAPESPPLTRGGLLAPLPGATAEPGLGYRGAIRTNPLRGVSVEPRSHTIYDAWQAPDGATFFAAECGSVFELTGDSLRRHEVEPGIDFYGVCGFARDEVWVVGTYGTVRRYDGRRWHAVAFPSDTWLEAIWASALDDIWVAGDGGALYRRDRTSWQRVECEATSRFYGLSGDGRGVVVAVGAHGSVVRAEGGVASRVASGTRAHLHDVRFIAGRNRFLACGREGALLWLSQDTVEPVDLSIRGALYGIGEDPQGVVEVVGWRGTALRYDGREWQRQYLGDDSFMEAVVHDAAGATIAAGWYGRIMRRAPETGRWTTLHSGRGESIRTLAVASDGSLVGGAEEGALLFLDAAGSLQTRFVEPKNVNALAWRDDVCWIVGNYGLACRVTRERIETIELPPGELKRLIAILEADAEHCTVLDWSGAVYDYRDGRFDLVRQFKIPRGRRLRKAIALTPTKIVALDEKGDAWWCRVGREAGRTPSDQEFHDIFRDAAGALFAVGPSQVLRLTEALARPVHDLAALLQPGERARRGCAGTAPDDLAVGGDRGSVLLSRGGVVERIGIGTDRGVTALDWRGEVLGVGVTGARMVRLSTGVSAAIESASLSAPRLHDIVALDDGALVVGEMGSIYALDAELRPTSIGGARFDLYTALRLDSRRALLGGVGELVLIRDRTPVGARILEGVSVMSLLESGDRIWLGTADGTVLTLPRAALQDETWQDVELQRLAQLGSPVVDLLEDGDGQVAIVENGGVIRLDGKSPPQPVVTFRRRRFSARTGDPSRYGIAVAGGRDFVCFLGAEGLELSELPETIAEVSLHGGVDGLGYLVGGSSGTLLLRRDDAWHKLHTGIGNQLFATGRWRRHLLVAGAHGALRHADITELQERLEDHATGNANRLRDTSWP